MQASPARLIVRAVATIALAPVLGVASTIPAPPPTATVTEVLARVTHGDAGIESYAAPVRIDVRLHRLISLRFHLNGTEYFKRPDRLALDLHAVPEKYRRLFAELGTPLTWSSLYDLRLVASSTQPGAYQLEGTPKHPGDVERMVVDVRGDASAPLHAKWFCTGGGTIDMRITEQAGAGGYALPQHAEADMNFGGYAVHAAFDYGPYTVNETLADAVFAGR